jgi:hypothetical protein
LRPFFKIQNLPRENERAQRNYSAIVDIRQHHSAEILEVFVVFGRVRILIMIGFGRYAVVGIEPFAEVYKFASLGAERKPQGHLLALWVRNRFFTNGTLCLHGSSLPYLPRAVIAAKSAKNYE